MFGAVALALGLMGPIGFVRRYVRKFAVWAVLRSIVYLRGGRSTRRTGTRSGTRRAPAALDFGQGIDLVVASVVSWTPLAADYTRFARDRRGAFLGAGVGYFLPTLWCFALGAVLVLSSAT